MDSLSLGEPRKIPAAVDSPQNQHPDGSTIFRPSGWDGVPWCKCMQMLQMLQMGEELKSWAHSWVHSEKQVFRTSFFKPLATQSLRVQSDWSDWSDRLLSFKLVEGVYFILLGSACSMLARWAFSSLVPPLALTSPTCESTPYMQEVTLNLD